MRLGGNPHRANYVDFAYLVTAQKFSDAAGAQCSQHQGLRRSVTIPDSWNCNSNSGLDPSLFLWQVQVPPRPHGALLPEKNQEMWIDANWFVMQTCR